MDPEADFRSGARGRGQRGGKGALWNFTEASLLEFYNPGSLGATRPLASPSPTRRTGVRLAIPGSVKSYQHYLTVCYRQSGNLVRFEKSARSLKSHDVSRLSAPKTFEMAPERGSEPRPGRRIRVRIRYGSYTDPIRFSRIRAF